MRVAITGSRTWTNPTQTTEALYAVQGLAVAMDQKLTVVHGACPEGPDRHAANWCRMYPNVAEERYPADWNKWGKVAGFRRNDEMSASGLTLVLAFWDGMSRGTKDMIDRCEARGVPVIVNRFTNFD